MARHRCAEAISEAELVHAISRTPLDHFVIWAGRPAGAQPGSLRSRALGLVREPWKPIPLRTLIVRAAAVEAGAGLDPDVVRSAVRMHQAARPAVYFLVRRAATGDFLAVTDVPYPLGDQPRLRAGDCVMTREGQAFAPAEALAG